MNIPGDANITDMGWDGTKTEKGFSWKLHNELDTACTQECVGDYVKGTSIKDVSESGVLHTHSPTRNISGTFKSNIVPDGVSKAGEEI